MIVMVNHIKEFRKALGLTQTGLGSLCGLSQQTIWELESGRRQPSAYNAGIIAHVLGKSFNDVFEFMEV